MVLEKLATFIILMNPLILFMRTSIKFYSKSKYNFSLGFQKSKEYILAPSQ